MLARFTATDRALVSRRIFFWPRVQRLVSHSGYVEFAAVDLSCMYRSQSLWRALRPARRVAGAVRARRSKLAAIPAADVAGYSCRIGTDEEGTLDRLSEPPVTLKHAILKQNRTWAGVGVTARDVLEGRISTGRVADPALRTCDRFGGHRGCHRICAASIPVP